MISKHYETGFVKNHRTLGAEALLEGWMVRMKHKEQNFLLVFEDFVN